MWILSVYKEHRKIFIVSVFFVLAQTILTIKQIECVPFFLWGHYSAKMETKGVYEKVVIKINNENFNYTKLPFFTREMITLPIIKYHLLLTNNKKDLNLQTIKKTFPNLKTEFENRLFNSEKDINEFPNWLKRYLECICEKKINSLEVDIVAMEFSSKILIKSSERLISI